MAEPFEEEEFMTDELKAAEQEIYDKVAALRKSMPPLLSFNLAHVGGTIRLETLLDRGRKLQHKSDEQFEAAGWKVVRFWHRIYYCIVV